MRVKSILFSTDMVRAILDGRKTVIRCVAKKVPIETHRIEINIREDLFDDTKWKEFECHWGGYQQNTGGFVDGMCVVVPPYQPRDILYVRETWQHGYGGTYIYKASAGHDLFMTPEGRLVSDISWKSPVTMPKEAARIWLKVTDVRVERLQDITDEQAQREGCTGEFIGTGEAMGSGWRVTLTEEFSKLWETTIKHEKSALYGWDANPWVWVIEFERCEKPREVCRE